MHVSGYGSSTLLNTLQTGGADSLFQTIIANNHARVQARISQAMKNITPGKDVAEYEKVTTSADSVTEAMNALEDEKLWDTESEDFSMDTLVSKITNFTNAYNNMLTNIDKVGKTVKSEYAPELSAILSHFGEDLAAVGVTVSSDGKLLVDADKMKAADVGKLKELFGKDAEFAKTLKAEITDLNEVVSQAVSIQNKLSGLYDSSSSSVDYSALLGGNTFDSLG